MKRKRFSVEQIVAIVKQAEMGMPVAELIRRVGISEQTVYRWKKPSLRRTAEGDSHGSLICAVLRTGCT
jgi:putative transposase